MTFEIKIQNMQQFSTWLCSVTIAQILQIIRRKSSAKSKFTGSTAHFIEKRVYSQIHTREGKTFILAKTRRVSRRPVNPLLHTIDTIFLFYRVNKTVSRTGWVVAHLWILFSGWHCNFYPTTGNVRRVISIKIAKFLWNKPGKLVSINRAVRGLSSCFDVTAVSS